MTDPARKPPLHPHTSPVMPGRPWNDCLKTAEQGGKKAGHARDGGSDEKGRALGGSWDCRRRGGLAAVGRIISGAALGRGSPLLLLGRGGFLLPLAHARGPEPKRVGNHHVERPRQRRGEQVLEVPAPGKVTAAPGPGPGSSPPRGLETSQRLPPRCDGGSVGFKQLQWRFRVVLRQGG